MSRTPDDSAKRDAVGDYVDAWDAILDWTAEGRSWSGQERHCGFINLADGSFADVSGVLGIDVDDDGRGIGLVDWDHDGRVDLWMTARTAPQVRFFHNRSQSTGHFLAIHLEGRTCNRDAIGSRVEVITAEGAAGSLRKTLRAGEGYLSQSSKWLHFGLGNASGEVRIRIEWPDGSVSEHDELPADRHYRMVQGESPVAWSRPTPAVQFAAGPLTPAEIDGGVRLLASRVDLPPLTVTTASGTDRALTRGTRTHTLLVLWASWCRPCLGELQDLSEEAAALRELGVEIFALSVDGLGNDSSDFAAAARLAERLQFDFPIAAATPDMLQTLQDVDDAVFMARRPLPLPSSFLIDSEGRLAAIYKGPVAVDELRQHVAKLSLPAERTTHREPSLPGPLAVSTRRRTLGGAIRERPAVCPAGPLRGCRAVLSGGCR